MKINEKNLVGHGYTRRETDMGNQYKLIEFVVPGDIKRDIYICVARKEFGLDFAVQAVCLNNVSYLFKNITSMEALNRLRKNFLKITEFLDNCHDQ